jgi:uncharacterized zinc-type alcohol dehydrogenase-like protein
MENNKNGPLRRKFIKQPTLTAASLLLASPLQIFSQTIKSKNMSSNIKSKGYAGKDTWKGGTLEL